MSKNASVANSDGLMSEEVAALIKTIDGRLYLLGWTREHPRIKAFIEAANKKKPSLLKSGQLKGVAPKYLKRLSELLELYWRCEQLMNRFGFFWEHPTIQELTSEYGGADKMPLLGWKHLYECLENKYFLMNMPTSDKSTTKSNVKK